MLVRKSLLYRPQIEQRVLWLNKVFVWDTFWKAVVNEYATRDQIHAMPANCPYGLFSSLFLESGAKWCQPRL